MHSAYLLPGALLDQVGVNLQLVLVLLEAAAILLHVGLFLRLEVDNLDRIVFAPNEINAALEDVLVLDQRYLDLSLLDSIPVTILSLVVAHDVQQCRLLRAGGKVHTLFLGKLGVICREPGCNALSR
ncbi:hypothetical protein D3C80_1843790 [compost metagenome]